MIKKYSIMGLVLMTLSLIYMGPLYATMTPKSTIITINGDDIGTPLVCVQDLACELRNEGISFILRHDSVRITVFNGEDVQRACEAGYRAGVNATIVTMGADHFCFR